jgi:hypothetical protein
MRLYAEVLCLEASIDGHWLVDWLSNKRYDFTTLPGKRMDSTAAFGGDRPFVLSQIVGDFGDD